jgi:hypothetical protein
MIAQLYAFAVGVGVAVWWIRWPGEWRKLYEQTRPRKGETDRQFTRRIRRMHSL